MARLTDKEIWEEYERSLRRVLIDDNPYGYKLNINNPNIKPLYYAYKQVQGIPHMPPSDNQRHEFERDVAIVLMREYERVYKDKLRAPIKMTWQEDKLNELVASCLDVEGIKKELTLQWEQRKPKA